MLFAGKNTFLAVLALVLLVVVWSPRPQSLPSGREIFKYTGVFSNANEGHTPAVDIDLTDDETSISTHADSAASSNTESNEQGFHIATAPPNNPLTLAPATTATLALTSAQISTTQAASDIEFTGLPDVIPDIEDIEPAFSGDKWFFQEDVQFPPPRIDVRNLERFAPHNYQGPGHKTFATYLATRNGSIHDPYFCAAQQLVFRLLWDSEIKSHKYPVTIFVAPFVDHTQREVLAAAGALVREIELVPWHPSDVTLPMRWRDQFSKLSFWAQTDFSRIVYLDTDAFPLHNIDELMDLVPEQTCDRDLLSEDDEPYESEICEYAFGAYMQDEHMINGGVLVLKPNAAMHKKLIRGMETEDFDTGAVEQGLLSKIFHEEGPFPVTWLERKWNGFFSKMEDEGQFMIMHEKLWALTFQEENLPWAVSYFNDTWFDMLSLYESKEFVVLREQDGLVSKP